MGTFAKLWLAIALALAALPTISLAEHRSHTGIHAATTQCLWNRFMAMVRPAKTRTVPAVAYPTETPEAAQVSKLAARLRSGLVVSEDEAAAAVADLLGVEPSDTVFWEHGVLAVAGPSIPFKAALFGVLETLANASGGLLDSLARSKAYLFHGSNSSSLLAFTEYGGGVGELVPTGRLLESGRVPFSGELTFGRKGVNDDNLSTVFITKLKHAIEYTRARFSTEHLGTDHRRHDWTPQIARERIHAAQTYRPPELGGFSAFLAKATAAAILEIEPARLAAWEKLNHMERQFVTESFPVVYGIRPQRRNWVYPVKSDVPMEIGVKGGAKRNEIRVIYVPRARIASVDRVVNSDPSRARIAIEPIELLTTSG